MAATIKQKFRGKTRDDYLELIQRLPHVKITSERMLKDALQVVGEMVDIDPKTPGQSLYFDALCDLVEVYENGHHAIGLSTEASLLAHLLESRGMSQVDLARELGVAKSTISNVLNGRRSLSKKLQARAAAFFGVGADIFASLPEATESSIGSSTKTAN